MEAVVDQAEDAAEKTTTSCECIFFSPQSVERLNFINLFARDTRRLSEA